MALDELKDAQRRIARAIELNDAFQVLFIFGSAAPAQDVVALAVADVARTAGEAINLMWFLPADAAVLVENNQDPTRAVWVISCGDSTAQVSEQLGELNRKRDSMASHPRTTLVLLLPASHHAGPARHAPDLWSIRTVSLSVDEKTRRAQPGEDLAAWRSACERAFESRLQGKPELRERYKLGTYTYTYRVRPAKRLRSLKELRDLMSQIGGWTGWRPWWVPTRNGPYSAEDDVLECWMVALDATFRDPAHSDFWRASSNGYFHLLRGYDEDSTDMLPRGERFSLGLPVWRTGEALFHAQQVAEALVEGFAEFEFTATWSGLCGRTTTEWPSPDGEDVGAPSLRRDVISSTITTDGDEVNNDLVGVVTRLVRPLYDAFLEAPSEEFIASNLADMRRRPIRY